MSILSVIFLLIACMSIIGMFILSDENNCTTPVYMLIATISLWCVLYIEFHPKETAAQKSINERYNQLTTAEKSKQLAH